MSDNSASLNSAQLAIWMHEEVAADAALYVEHICFELLGPIHRPRLEQALRTALDAHPILGACIAGNLPQLRLITGRVPAEIIFREVAEAELSSVLAAESLAGVRREGPLCRCLVLELTPSHHVLLLVWHHLAMDGAGARVLLRDIALAWSGLPVRPGMLVYPDSVKPDNQGGSQVIQRAAAIAERLSCIELQPLPRRSDVAEVSLCAPIDQRIPDLAVAARESRVTMAMLVNAAYQGAFGDVLGLDVFILGCATAGQTSVVEEGAVGCFVNTVFLRADSNPVGLLRRSAREFARALEDRDVPSSAVGARLMAQVHPRPTSFPQIYLTLDEALELTMDGLDCCRRWVRQPQAKFDISLEVEYSTDGVTGALCYRSTVLEPDVAQRLVTKFLTRLRATAQG